MKHILAAILIIFGAIQAIAQLTTATPGGRQVKVEAVTPYIVRVDNTASGEKIPEAQTVILPESGDKATVWADGRRMTTTGGIDVRIEAEGEIMISSARKGSTIIDTGDRRGGISIATSGAGSFYGGGERGHAYNLRGDTLVMYNRQNYGYTGDDPRISQMNITMPLFLSSDGYALLFDDFAASEIILSNPIRYISESPSAISYYYICGDNLAELTEHISDITGRQPLPPLWAMGYITSKYGYHNQGETEGTVEALKAMGYPVDGIVLDLYWYGVEQDMGRLAWDSEQFPDPKGMLGRLADKGVHTVAISQPYVVRNGRGIDNYNELASKGMFVKDGTTGEPQEVEIWIGEGGMFDMSNPDTRAWLKERYAQLTDLGMSGWWGDLGEPEKHPETGVHANGLPTRLYHNKYGNDWSSIIAELYAERYPERRLFTMMRGGTTGLQKYGVFPWSTDVSRSWGGLEPQVRIMLHSGMSGMGYMSSDLGGFAVDPSQPYQPELYVRWLQAGLFSPIFRTHAQLFPEPFYYTQYEDIVKGIVKERYRWLPYNYTLAAENAMYGYPLVRPLDFRDSNARGEYDKVSDEYLWGDALLVAPVMAEGAVSREIVLPAGAGWYDWYDGKLYDGGTTLADYPAPLDKLPMFVRAGSFIPLADYEMGNTSDYRADAFTVRYYPGGEATGYLYDDDRATAGSASRIIRFRGDGGRIEISSEGTFEGAPDKIDFTFEVLLPQKPSKVTVGGKSVSFDYSDGFTTFTATYKAGTVMKIEIK